MEIENFFPGESAASLRGTETQREREREREKERRRETGISSEYQKNEKCPRHIVISMIFQKMFKNKKCFQ